LAQSSLSSDSSKVVGSAGRNLLEIMSGGMPMPMSQRMALPVATTPVRYAHVAHFVGLSLLRDPNLARPKLAKSASLPQVGAAGTLPIDDGMDEPQQSMDSIARSSLSVERVDQLRCQINWLKAERRCEQEQLKKLSHSLSDSQISEKKAHERANFQRDRKEKQEEHVRNCKVKVMQAKSHRSQAPPADNGRQLQGGLLPRVDAGASAKAANLPMDALQVRDRDFEAPGNDQQLDAMARSAPSLLAAGNIVAAGEEEFQVVDPLAATSDTLTKKKAPGEIQMFETEAELNSYRRRQIREELLCKNERRADPTGEILEGREVSFFEMRLGLMKLKLPDQELQDAWHSHMVTVQEGNAVAAFALINLNGSGRICSQEFADGVERVGVQWQKLTGLRKGKDLFRLFDTDKNGTLTLFELFPTERNKPKNSGGATTPEFWKTYCRENPIKSFALDQPKGRHPPWNTGVAEDGLNVLYTKEKADADAAFMRKWMQTTMRRLKGRGKSDARCREMCCMHLPTGTGPKDRQEVATFSDNEVKQCKREYTDAVSDKQRVVEKALYDLKMTRNELWKSRQKLWHVAMEPQLKAQALEEQKNVAKNMGLGLGIGKKADLAEEDPPKKTLDNDMKGLLGGMTPF